MRPDIRRDHGAYQPIARGAAVPATKITLTNVATNAVRTPSSTDSGDYTFPSVAPGFYNIKFEHAGFKTGKHQ